MKLSHLQEQLLLEDIILDEDIIPYCNDFLLLLEKFGQGLLKKKWHEEFIGQTLLAPVFFILLYVALTILSSLTEALNKQLKVIEGQDGDFILSLALILITAVLVIFAF
jgi:uncharacterized membrane protein SirB2